MVKIRLPIRSGHKLDVEFHEDGTMIANGEVEITASVLKPKLTRFAWDLILHHKKSDAGVKEAVNKLITTYA
jgi:hypothetical protein